MPPMQIAEGRESGYDSHKELRDTQSRDAAGPASQGPDAALAPPLPPLLSAAGQLALDSVFDDVDSVISDDGDGYQCGAYEIGDVDC